MDGHQQVHYAVRLVGHIDKHCSDRFDGWTISHEDGGTTVLTGFHIDQSALHGLLHQVSDLGMILVSINLIAIASPRLKGKR